MDPVMNRRILALALIALLLLTAGCRKAAVEPTEPAAAPTEPSETLLPGVGLVDEGVVMEEEEDEATEPTEAATEPEKDDETTPKETEPEKETKPTEKPGDEETTPPTQSKPDSAASAYSDYMNMSAAEQEAFINSFESVDAFMAWFNAAKDEHNANDNSIEIGSGTIDLEEITGGN